jgi:nicotinate phosphoribosyltransferase
MNDAATSLLAELYQLNMLQAYLEHGETKTAVFEFFVRNFSSGPALEALLLMIGADQ